MTLPQFNGTNPTNGSRSSPDSKQRPLLTPVCFSMHDNSRMSDHSLEYCNSRFGHGSRRIARQNLRHRFQRRPPPPLFRVYFCFSSSFCTELIVGPSLTYLPAESGRSELLIKSESTFPHRFAQKAQAVNCFRICVGLHLLDNIFVFLRYFFEGP